ncbi:GreA/GreB family elongation factor [Pedobacter rhizosphaerae]|uniref:Regulator of nucleoside diphosphate kinase n=1 Tax=Pedobacter rhizosphaerae TaxID=390241 RepID=A0A1H9UUP1_9SPHI|nr:GreA/GreB family elongation factor [Pedobacter rhizosphaerae]SES13142.1 regulator of nucleoside diphosphate kinase [Pedobacter rhizosphaerae]
MNLNENNPVIITQEDYDLLKPYFSKSSVNEMSLSAELSRAMIIKSDAFPPHAIRLNSKVWITEESTGETTELTIVLPQYADIKARKISVLTPIAAALIGFRKGESVQWKVPAGLKVFKITDVKPPEVND